ncbi:transcription repressor OFP5-like [Forsythia ovata]|uniref:Transcription repressor n=1 Tax=Forsythia ovata TaxID=205694 RepID=A0ABD1QBW3_9LAMI
MKWGRKKSASPSTHCQSLISRVFPVSWLVKFKQNGVSFEPNSAQKKQKSVLNSPSSRSFECASWKEGRFCNTDDDVYWKLLFGEERIEDRKSARGKNSVRYYSDNELEFPMEMTREDNQQFNDMAQDTRKLKEMQHELRNMWENHASRRKKGNGKAKPRKVVRSNATSQDQDFNLDRQQSKDRKIKDIISNIEPRTKSAYISRESTTRTKQNSRVKVYSPRTECKIRALEDIKKARMKSKKKTKERAVFDSFAVVKCSFAPEQDFRDSMVEMIREKGIRRLDELVELLASYLTLNCDKYHDLIIKVFQQVNQEFIDHEIGNDHLIY